MRRVIPARKTIIMVLWSCWLCLTSVAQDYARITHFGVEDGLMEHTVSRGLQDSFGYIWFSTHNGLVRFDGHRFVTYKARPGDHSPLQTNLIDYIEEQPNHDILCLSQHVYYIFHRATATFEYLCDDTVQAPHDDSVDSVVARRIRQLPEYSNINYKIRLIDRQGGVWVRSSRGLERVTFPRRPIRTFKATTDDAEEYVCAMMADTQDRLWVADHNGYVRLLSADRGQTLYLTPDGHLSSLRTPFGCDVCCIFEDSRHRVWLGTRKHGLFLLTSDGPQRYGVTQFINTPRQAESLNDSTVYAIAEDGRHRIWVGCYDGGGLNMVVEQPGRPISFLNRRHGLKNFPAGVGNRIRCMYIVGDTLLVGSNFGLITTRIVEHPKQMRFYVNQRNAADASTLSNNRIMGIETDTEGRVYLATYGGGICITRTDSLLSSHIRFTTLSEQNGLPSDVCLDIYRDCNQQMWVDSEYTLSQIGAAEGTFTNYSKGMFRGGFLFTEANPLCLSDGTLVFGTTQGLLQFNLDDIRKSSFVPPVMVELRREDGTVTPCPERLELTSDEKNFQLLLAALDYDRNEDLWYAYRLEGIDQNWHYTRDDVITYTSFPPGTYKLSIKSTNGDGLWVDNERTIVITRRAAFHEQPYAWMLYGALFLLLFVAVVYTLRYIRKMQREMSSYRLAAREKMEYMEIRMQELMKRSNSNTGSNTGSDSAATPQETAEEAGERQFREKVEQFIRQQIDNTDLTIDDCATQMLMSRSAFYLRVKKNYGVSPNNFIQNFRLQYAMKLMRDTAGSISEIAYRSGFSDPKYFSRAFKKATGQTPTEYREQL